MDLSGLWIKARTAWKAWWSAPWVQEPFPYQGKCLQWLRVEYARLGEADRERVDGMLAGTGCEALVARPGK